MTTPANVLKDTPADSPSLRLPVTDAAICWLSRQPGLPRGYGLRWAVITRHPGPCPYCTRDAGELLAAITRWSAENDHRSRFDRDGHLADAPRQQRAAA